MIRTLLFTILYIGFIGNNNAQVIKNPDLDGQINGLSSLPDFWQSVPRLFIHCLATDEGLSNTPDLLDSLGPNPYWGTYGIPYSGKTFVSGEYGIQDDFYDIVYHEGIQQSVSGFTPNVTYAINFHQSVVKTYVCLDQSGSWAVYIDNELIGISSPSFSNKAYNDKKLDWEARKIVFVASANEHIIRFLPYDDDDSHFASSVDTTGSLRMGIDSIYISGVSIKMPNVFTPNGDGINDKFLPLEKIDSEKAMLEIFNRWGEKIYETNDLQSGWDGTSNNNLVSEGVYYWSINILTSGEWYEKKTHNLGSGFLSLIR